MKEEIFESLTVIVNLLLFCYSCLLLFIALAGLPHDIQNVDFIVPHKFKLFRVSQENQFNLKEFSQIFFKIF